jgi:hypothetical protein
MDKTMTYFGEHVMPRLISALQQMRFHCPNVIAFGRDVCLRNRHQIAEGLVLEIRSKRE